MFVFYAFALTKRLEALGSVMALVSMIAAYVVYMVILPTSPPNLFFLAVGAPALFHLAAIVLHRYELKWVKS